MTLRPRIGLILSGGGARAAYQIGVLRTIARYAVECGAPTANPFGILVGTSAGAINASALACRADRFAPGVDQLVHIWQNFSAEQVYRADSLSMLRTGAPWLTMLSLGWLLARWKQARPRSLLDNSPLDGLLQQLVRFDRLPGLIAAGHLQALAVTASSYTSGEHITFFDGLDNLHPWSRHQRRAVRTRFSVAHLLASAAIPFVFPSIVLPLGGQREWFGDGAMRQVAPIAPAVHLGADKVLVIGAGRMYEPAERHVLADGYPSVAQIAGHTLSSIFLDALAADIERLQRINQTLALLPPEARHHTTLRPIESLVIAPSERLDDIAARHLHHLPLTVRTLLGAVGVGGRGGTARGSAFASYLLFEAPYTRELITLGQHDTEARRDEVLRFFGWQMPHQPTL